jgi:hypothetical protein
MHHQLNLRPLTPLPPSPPAGAGVGGAGGTRGGHRRGQRLQLHAAARGGLLGPQARRRHPPPPRVRPPRGLCGERAGGGGRGAGGMLMRWRAAGEGTG